MFRTALRTSQRAAGAVAASSRISAVCTSTHPYASPPVEPIAPIRPSAPQPTTPVVAPAPTPAVADEWEPPALQGAFAALLAAERGQPLPAPPGSAPHISDELIDEIARRVIVRMGDDAMRTAVLDAAERLVRQEIDRIKSQR